MGKNKMGAQASLIEPSYISARFLRDYCRDPVGLIMRNLIPEDQMALSVATGCRPVSPMVILLRGRTTKPIKFYATLLFTGESAPIVRPELTHTRHIRSTRELFHKPGTYEFIHWLYPEVSHLYEMSGPATRPDNADMNFYMYPNKLTKKHWREILSLLYEEKIKTTTMITSQHCIRSVSYEYFQQTKEKFLRKHNDRTRRIFFDITHMNDRHVAEDLLAGRPVAILDNPRDAQILYITCRCNRGSAHMRKMLTIHYDQSLGRPRISRDTYEFIDRFQCCQK